jgi:hypothetical protein
MTRPVNPNAQYTIKPHTTKGHTYASTQPYTTNPTTGKKQYKHKHWGTIDQNNKFTPNTTYHQTPQQEKNKLIFPKHWNLTNITQQTQNQQTTTTTTNPTCNTQCQNRLYGDIWLLEQIAQKTGITQDLNTVFNQNHNIVNNILTLAMYPYITNHTYNRLNRWQKIAKTPSTNQLTPTEITRLTQSITEQHRIDLLKLRAQRLNKDELCAIDSTTRSAYGNSLTDIRWGKNKEHLPLPQTTEVVVYSLTSHLPVFYQSFPGNMPDTKSLETILAVLEHANFKAVIYVTDRGYDSLHNLLNFISKGQAFIMCVKVGQRDVLRVIKEFGDFSTRPEGMAVDSKERIYYHQYDVVYGVKDSAGVEVPVGLKLNLYFDPVRRGVELLELDIVLSAQKVSLEEHLRNGSVMGDDAFVRREFGFYRVVCDPVSRVILSFVLDGVKVDRARWVSGFFAIMSSGVGFGALETLVLYSLGMSRRSILCR